MTKIDLNYSTGELAPGVRPGVTGWYWCMREGYAAAEIVHIVAGARHGAPRPTKLCSVSLGVVDFEGSDYNNDTTRWFGPLEMPFPVARWPNAIAVDNGAPT